MKVYLNKCKVCKKKFGSKRGMFGKKVIIDKNTNKEMVVDVPVYGLAGVRCPRCGSELTKTIAVLNVR